MMSMDFSEFANILINFVLAVFTLGTLITAILTFRQAKEFEKERTRPIMQAHLRMNENHLHCLELALSNAGQTIAHNVTFRFIPDLPELPLEVINCLASTRWTKHPLDIVRQRLLSDPIQTWVPGYEITVMFWSFRKDGKLDASAEGIPAKSKIEINYTDGYKKPTRYSDVFELNAALLFGTAEARNL